MAPRPETANRTSTFIGNWLRGQRRDKWVIASKVTGERAARGAGMGHGWHGEQFLLGGYSNCTHRDRNRARHLHAS